MAHNRMQHIKKQHIEKGAHMECYAGAFNALILTVHEIERGGRNGSQAEKVRDAVY